MRGVLTTMMSGVLVLALGTAGRAQDQMNAFGSYPAGITTGSPYGFYPGGYQRGLTQYRVGSTNYTVPTTTYYNSGFYGGVPGTTTYSPGVNFSSPNATAYGGYYGYPTTNPRYVTPGSAPSFNYGAVYTGTAPGYTGYTGAVPTYRRGLLGRRYYRW